MILRYVSALFALAPILSSATPLISDSPSLTQSVFQARTPFIAKLHQFNSSNGSYSPMPNCGGGLFVQSKGEGAFSIFFITAAHCFAGKGNTTNNTVVVANQVKTKWKPDDTNDEGVVFLIDHYAFPNNNTFEMWSAVRGQNEGFVQLGRDAPNDLAVLKLMPHPLSFHEAENLLLSLMDYKFQFDDGSAKVNDRLEIVSWGVENESVMSQPVRAKHAKVQLVANSVCNDRLVKLESGKNQSVEIESSSEWCMQVANGYPCKGDSGSVLFKLSADKTVTYTGILSSGGDEGCTSIFQRAMKIHPYVASTIRPFIEKYAKVSPQKTLQYQQCAVQVRQCFDKYGGKPLEKECLAMAQTCRAG